MIFINYCNNIRKYSPFKRSVKKVLKNLSFKNGIGMGILKDCKIKIKNFLKKLKKSVDKVEK